VKNFPYIIIYLYIFILVVGLCWSVNVNHYKMETNNALLVETLSNGNVFVRVVYCDPQMKLFDGMVLLLKGGCVLHDHTVFINVRIDCEYKNTGGPSTPVVALQQLGRLSAWLGAVILTNHGNRHEKHTI
jgi:hypothetical protein